jgi:hypothetical protein
MLQQSNYESLRSWYLAKLRKSAIEAQVSGQLTPSALIAADREVIEKLIAERSEADEGKAQAKKKNSAALAFVLFLWLYLIVGVMVSIFLYCLADGSIFMDVLMVSVNPANLAASGNHSLPSQLALLLVQLVLYIYPVCFIPYALFSKSS